MQSLNIGFSLAKNSSLESCASSESLPYRVLKMMARDTKYLRCFVKQRLFWASFPSAPQLHFCEPPSLSLYQTWYMKSLFLCRFCLQACHSSALRNLKPLNCPSTLPRRSH